MQKKVCIVVPNYKLTLNENEKVSLKQLIHVLGGYHIVVVEPLKLRSQISECKMVLKQEYCSFSSVFFNDCYFQNTSTYNKLLLSPAFYKSFLGWEYILIYQLDCYVFRDELMSWVDKNYDFIGAPWMNRMKKVIPGLNGGLSLRKVKSHLKVLYSFSYIYSIEDLKSQKFYQQSSVLKKGLRLGAALTIKNNTFHLFNDFASNEDQFFTQIAVRNFSWFKIPDTRAACKFAFEMFPERLFELNDENLPFGCHAWQKYGEGFWSEYIKGA